MVSLDELHARRGGDAAAGEGAEPWSYEALRGRLVELSAHGASATLTAATGLVLEAQLAGEPVAWIAASGDSFYPPDVAESGVDLAALVVVRARELRAAVRAAERLLRSGAFGLVVLDLAAPGVAPELSLAHQGRLVTLAMAHDAALVCLTSQPARAPSLGSMVSLRVEALRERAPDGGHHVTLRALKDKRRGPGWLRRRRVRGG